MNTLINSLNKQVFQNILEFYKKNDSYSKTAWSTGNYSHHKCIRSLGVMEGILLSYGMLIPGQTFDFKMVDVIEWGWFGKKHIVTRKQTYSEFIVELFEELINKTD